MEKEKFERVLEINERLKNLHDILGEISPYRDCRLSYFINNNKGCAEWKMKHISDLLDKHDKMIRSEIQKEIDNLHAEIETL